MKKADLNKFKKMLLDKRRLLATDIQRMEKEVRSGSRGDSSGNPSAMPIHMADISADNYELEITLGLIESEEREVKEIDAALERIKEGSYGTCETCEVDIKAARLKAIPNARLCIKCKRIEEENLG
ncbi:MAG: TraR/DksA family transcriptional regulator [Planctomycetota bacterium]|jgi:RNA polymerase-binding protein DksA